ncbi:MAG: M48 family metallopeptidase [Chloroflexota bacterium]
MQPKKPSLAGRAFLAVLLLIGFYVLALVIVIALLGMLYAMFAYSNRIDLRVILFALIGAGTVLWSIIPRRDNFIAPGPKLNPADHPQLFAAVNEIAMETDQAPPAEIYADAQVNAWVANRGGVMGIGSKRIMGVGLPLLQGLSVSQFKAVLAHEFGHYDGGDTQLGPWIYQTRSIIGRTITNLAQQNSFLHKPFLWYGNMFLRVTHAISRQQEYAADALAARTVGTEHLVEGLKRVHGSAVAYDLFWNRHIAPVLNAGYHAPLAEGFGRFIKTKDVQSEMEAATAHAIKNQTQDPFDTHPPLPMRIEAVSQIKAEIRESDERPATSLLGSLPGLESEIFTSLAHLNGVSRFNPIDWEKIGSKVYLPGWKQTYQNYGKGLNGITLEQLPEIAGAIGAHIPTDWQSNTTPESRAAQFRTVIGIGIALLLQQNGWEIKTQVEDQAYFICEDMTIFPFKISDMLATGEMSADSWREICQRAKLGAVDLGQLSV